VSHVLAIVAAHVRKFYDDEAKARQKAAGIKGNKTRHGKSPVQEKVPEAKGQSRDQAGAAVGVNGRYVDLATKVIDKGTAQTTPENLPDLDLATRVIGKVAAKRSGKFTGP